MKLLSLLLMSILLLSSVSASFWFSSRVEAQFEQWVTHVPQPQYVELDYWKKNGTSYMNVSIMFPSTGYNVSSLGNPVFADNTIVVDAEIWRWTGIVCPVILTGTYTYNLGNLPTGDYIFRFKVWGFPVKNATLTVIIVVPDDYPTIQEGINNTQDGGTIFVRNGVYYENIVVTKPVSLIGESNINTKIDSNNTGDCINIKAKDVALKGFTLLNGYPTDIMVCENVTGTLIKENIVLSAEWGIYLSLCSNNTIEGNAVMNCSYGLFFESSSYNLIVRNTIAYNHYGVTLKTIPYILLFPPPPPSKQNILYHNSFCDNSFQVIDAGFATKWDNDCEGNFWSNYNGTDLNNDGIGDTSIPWETVDYYPLMNGYWNPADINHDMKCDISDVARTSAAFGSFPGHPKWNPHCDITGPEYLVPDGKVDISDLAVVTANYGKYKQPSPP